MSENKQTDYAAVLEVVSHQKIYDRELKDACRAGAATIRAARAVLDRMYYDGTITPGEQQCKLCDKWCSHERGCPVPALERALGVWK